MANPLNFAFMNTPAVGYEVNKAYQDILGRAPDAEGRAFYENLLGNDTMTVEQMRADMMANAGGNAGGGGQTQPVQPAQATPGGQMQAANNMITQASQGYTPQTAEVSTIAGQNLDPYLNPYTQNVIDNTLGTLDRNNQMNQNRLDANAAAAGAFGGSRHGVLGAEVQRGYQDQVADTTARMNQANFTNALNVAGQDVNSMNGMAQFNTGQMNAGGQFNSNMALNAGNAMMNLGGQNFSMRNQANNNLARDGAMQQQAMQALIEATKAQTQGALNAPSASLASPLAALGGIPGQGGTQTSTRQPGLMDYATLLFAL